MPMVKVSPEDNVRNSNIIEVDLGDERFMVITDRNPPFDVPEWKEIVALYHAVERIAYLERQLEQAIPYVETLHSEYNQRLKDHPTNKKIVEWLSDNKTTE